MDDCPGEVTQLLAKIASGNAAVSERLIPLVYAELRAMAGRCMRRERPDHTLQATVLVHEAFLRLVGEHNIQWQSRTHFFAIAAKVMRRVLIHYAREHRAIKRGGAGMRADLEDALEHSLLVAEDHLEEVLMVDESLKKLAAIDPAQSRLVELRFFAGMTVEETSAVMGLSTATVKREWTHAKAWLRREMKGRQTTTARGASAAG
jgi:RNA polymerase sigma factor (TIGR02999 family)